MPYCLLHGILTDSPIQNTSGFLTKQPLIPDVEILFIPLCRCISRARQPALASDPPQKRHLVRIYIGKAAPLNYCPNPLKFTEANG